MYCINAIRIIKYFPWICILPTERDSYVLCITLIYIFIPVVKVIVFNHNVIETKEYFSRKFIKTTRQLLFQFQAVFFWDVESDHEFKLFLAKKQLLIVKPVSSANQILDGIKIHVLLLTRISDKILTLNAPSKHFKISYIIMKF